MLKAADIQNEIAKGRFTPHTALTNMALAYYQDATNYFAKSIFPTVPVSLSSDNYYVFDKEDLLRDNWKRKPAYGKVSPVPVSEHTEQYACQVDQMIMGIDQIRQTDLTRRQAPATADPRVQRTRTIAEQLNIHQDRIFAQKFFKTGIWGQDMKGSTAASEGSTFIKFSDSNADPIKFIDEEKSKMLASTGRMPNRLALGNKVFNALKNSEAILDHVKYGGSTANPATVSLQVLAELFGVDQVVVLNSIMNKGAMGADANMGFIADESSFLLAYATPNPSIDEPSAGYIFTWDMLGDGQLLPILQNPGEPGTHTEYIEGLVASDMRATAKDLGYFYSEAV